MVLFLHSLIELIFHYSIINLNAIVELTIIIFEFLFSTRVCWVFSGAR